MHTHSNFKNSDNEEQSFMERLRNYNPQRSFLELQKITKGETEENDPFLQAVSKIRQEQQLTRKKKEKKKQKTS